MASNRARRDTYPLRAGCQFTLWGTYDAILLSNHPPYEQARRPPKYLSGERSWTFDHPEHCLGASESHRPVGLTLEGRFPALASRSTPPRSASSVVFNWARTWRRRRQKKRPANWDWHSTSYLKHLSHYG